MKVVHGMARMVQAQAGAYRDGSKRRWSREGRASAIRTLSRVKVNATGTEAETDGPSASADVHGGAGKIASHDGEHFASTDVPGAPNEGWKVRLKRAVRNTRIELAALGGETGLLELVQSTNMPDRYKQTLYSLYYRYRDEVSRKYGSTTDGTAVSVSLFKRMLKIYAEELELNFQFPALHTAIRGPVYDYYALGNEYVHHLLDYDTSLVLHAQRFEQIVNAQRNGENVILLSNHQSEADAAFLPLLVAPAYPELGQDVIYIVGDRVVTDLLCKPFSMGRNLLCVHSRKRMDDEPELKQMKRRQNMRSVREMERLLSEGGKILWLAPSGGRDRPDETGALAPDEFDHASIEMIRKTVTRSAMPKTHCYPMAMFTHDILPPPSTLQREIGEERDVNFSKVAIGVAEEMDIDSATSEDLYNALFEEYNYMLSCLYSPENMAGKLPCDCSSRPWQWQQSNHVQTTAGF